MRLRLANPAARWIFLGISIFFGAGLSYSSLRNAWAEHRAESGTQDGLARATQLEPGNARNWYLLGRYWQTNVEQPDAARAIAAYREALSFDPRSAATWLDLADAYEEEGDIAAARQAFLEAKRNYPVSAEVAWRYGSFLLRQGESAAAFAEIRHAVEEEPSRAAEAVSRCWRANPDVQVILDEALPPARGVYLDSINFLAQQREAEAAMAAWERLARLRLKLEMKETYPLLEALLQKHEIADARTVWNQALELSGTERPADPPGSAIWDGGFESDTAGGGFGWRIQSQPGAQAGYDEQVRHSGARSLEIRFDGTQNVSFEGVCQSAAIGRGTAYEFSAWVRTEALTTDKGVFFRLFTPEEPRRPAAATAELRGSEPWTRVAIPWKAGKNVHLVQVCVERTPSQKLDNKIAGQVWVDDVALVPAASGSGNAAKVTP